MEFKEITNLHSCEEVKKIYEENFPPKEKIDFYDFFSGVFKNFKFFALYNGEIPVEIAHFNNTTNFVI